MIESRARTLMPAGRLAILPALLLAICGAFCVAGCALLAEDDKAGNSPPRWIDRPPSVEGFLCGVGRCGPTYLTGGSRKIAIARAAKDIYWQGRGLSEYKFSFDDESEDGTFSVQLSEGGEPVRKLEGLELIDEYFISEPGGPFTEGTHFVLLKYPAAQIRR